MRVDWGDTFFSVLIGSAVLSFTVPLLALMALFVGLAIHSLGWLTLLFIPFVLASYVIGVIVRYWWNRP